jgi:ATP-dependent Clp protease ATP-binding subunit ClpA
VTDEAGSGFLVRTGLEVRRLTAEAGRIAGEHGHPTIEVEHLLLAIVRRPTGLVAGLLERLGVRDEIADGLDQALKSARKPRP